MQNDDPLGQRDRLEGMTGPFTQNGKSILSTSENGKVKLTKARGKDAAFTV